ncbi:dynein axonemal light chain 1-like [Venturia canescens]|uniref:dynein axonemal light chain 1-like n=1 Tax=Venturia canescens TaxID=32260 RepID=UPI001C9C1B0C|nr:dynein axonemal light chain 1-like [Venturia canescens]
MVLKRLLPLDKFSVCTIYCPGQRYEYKIEKEVYPFRKLSLSTNMIEKINGIDSLRNLKILSLGRNSIKTFSGLEAVGDHLEELWISYNLIDKIKGVNVLKALKVLYMSHNLVKDWAEFNRLQEIPNLQELMFLHNPICENMDTEAWRAQVIRRLPALKKLDAITIV